MILANINLALKLFDLSILLRKVARQPAVLYKGMFFGVLTQQSTFLGPPPSKACIQDPAKPPRPADALAGTAGDVGLFVRPRFAESHQWSPSRCLLHRHVRRGPLSPELPEDKQVVLGYNHLAPVSALKADDVSRHDGTKNIGTTPWSAFKKPKPSKYPTPAAGIARVGAVWSVGLGLAQSCHRQDIDGQRRVSDGRNGVDPHR
ncbi:hypothetical protein BBP40_010028 [Aspergillus hancockii]|nr:hypothetical protein BBP40_010028 [Aspergillus hancockii]